MSTDMDREIVSTRVKYLRVLTAGSRDEIRLLAKTLDYG